MIVDTSAALAIFLNEPERENFRTAIAQANPPKMSSVTFLESSVVLARRFGEETLVMLDDWIAAFGITIVPFSDEHARIARQAYVTYGKGAHPARLSFGDCASYALAVAEDEPLLFKGGDFAKTDVRSAI